MRDRQYGSRNRRPKDEGFDGYDKQDANEFAKHAKEIKSLASGRDVVEADCEQHAPEAQEKRHSAFVRPGKEKEVQVVRSWLKSRPLEAKPAASAMVPYPRRWNQKRGRSSHIKAGQGAYGIFRARPDWN